MRRFVVVALALLMLVAFSGVAAAKPPAGAGAGKALLFNDIGGTHFTCSGGVSVTTGPAFGFVVMNTNGHGDLIVQVSVKGATPNATYDIWVNQNPGACPLGAATALGVLKTNGVGNGNAHVVLARFLGASTFWISAVGGGQVLRSTAVTLD